VALVCLVLLTLSTRTRADEPVHYFRERLFEIPYSIPPGTFRELTLTVSHNNRPFSRVATTKNATSKFQFEAPEDGWYKFVVVVTTLVGTQEPRDPERAIPSMRVCVDTVKPLVQFRPVTPTRYRAAIDWDVSDRNLNIGSLRLAYRPEKSERWTTLATEKLPKAKFEWNPQGTGPFEVSLEVSDLAGNTSAQTVRLDAPGSNYGGENAPASSRVDDRQVAHVNSLKFPLNFEVQNTGRSMLREVQIWMTKDTSMWSRYLKNAAKMSAPEEGVVKCMCDIEVPQAGRYGFYIRPVSGVGKGPPVPKADDLPQVWVEVDITPPKVSRVMAEAIAGSEEGGGIIVRWRAEDDFLAENPITLSYSESAAGPWTALPDRIDNQSGEFKITAAVAAKLPTKFFVRIEAVDRAGNKGSAQTQTAVVNDDKVPHAGGIKVGNVSISGPSNPAANPAPANLPPAIVPNPAVNPMTAPGTLPVVNPGSIVPPSGTVAPLGNPGAAPPPPSAPGLQPLPGG
jgi:hypothetical protein